MMLFTFVVLVYNQEKLILETLESIKYQVQNYAVKRKVDLIIIDDCSKDHTVEVVKSWILENESSFNECKLISNDFNKGTVINYNTAIDMIIEGDFKFIAGDDLFSSKNLFECYSDMNDIKLKSYFPLYLVDGKIEYDRKRLVKFYYHSCCKKNKKYNLKFMRKGGYFHTPSTIYTKDLYGNAKCSEMNGNFRLFEDDPTWYSMIKNVDDLCVEFSFDSIVLYRMHRGSVSNTINPVFLEELHKLNSMYIEDTKGFEKFLIRCKDKSYGRRFTLFNLINKISYVFILIRVKKQKRFKEVLTSIENTMKMQQQYYDNIKDK